jgi:hypothetical protein
MYTISFHLQVTAYFKFDLFKMTVKLGMSPLSNTECKSLINISCSCKSLSSVDEVFSALFHSQKALGFYPKSSNLNCGILLTFPVVPLNFIALGYFEMRQILSKYHLYSATQCNLF